MRNNPRQINYQMVAQQFANQRESFANAAGMFAAQVDELSSEVEFSRKQHEELMTALQKFVESSELSDERKEDFIRTVPGLEKWLAEHKAPAQQEAACSQEHPVT
jgi:Skp family chaperone for outer membrane proteins